MTDAERLHELLYSCESRDEMCERVVAMEQLVRDASAIISGCADYRVVPTQAIACEIEMRAHDLGITMD